LTSLFDLEQLCATLAPALKPQLATLIEALFLETPWHSQEVGDEQDHR
jgi:hypothetical protein